MEWKEVRLSSKNKSALPPSQDTHHCAVLVGTNILVLWHREHESGFCYLDLNQQTWNAIQYTGTLPSPRFANSLTLIDDKLVSFGGLTSVKLEETRYDLHVFDLVAAEWTLVEFDIAPFKRRFGHTADLVQSSNVIVIFGGFAVHANNTFVPTNELLLMSADNLCVQRHKAKGKPPAARSGHATLVESTRITIFGGRLDSKTNDSDSNDIHILTTFPRYTWSSPKCNGHIPLPVTGASLALLGGRFVALGGKNSREIGGVYCLERASWTWIRMEYQEGTGKPEKEYVLEGLRFAARAMHSATVLSSDELLVLGGDGQDFKSIFLLAVT